MPGPRNWTEELIEERLVKQRRGLGARETYRPWLTVQEVPTYGNASRIPSLLFRRSIHTLSNIERNLYLFFEYAGNHLPSDDFEPEVMRALEGKVKVQGQLDDWREQLPIPRELSLAHARAKRIRHSRYRKTNVPMVMSIDAMAVFKGGNDAFVDAKTAEKTHCKRVMNKLRLHKAYAEYLQRPHYIFTENSVSKTRLKNIDLVRSAMPKRGERMVPADLFSHHLNVVKHDIFQRRRICIADFCRNYDRANNFEVGTALRLVWCLVWNKHVRLDMEAQVMSDIYLSELRRGRP